MADAAPPAEPWSFAELLHSTGFAASTVERRPVVHGRGGTVIALALPSAHGATAYSGLWLGPDRLRFFGSLPAESGAAAAHGLSGVSAELFELFTAAAHGYLEGIEEVDRQLAEIQGHGRAVPVGEVWQLSRQVAAWRTAVGRARVALAEVGRVAEGRFPGLDRAAPALEVELERLQELARSVGQSLSDLILLRNAEESNRIAEAANELSRISNRIASLANTSNVRMLGLTYLALFLSLVGAIILFPNTAATILGMPTAAWVPGPWIVLVLVAATGLPALFVLSRPWVRRLARDLSGAEGRAVEGVADLPEVDGRGRKPAPPGGPPP